MPKFKISLIFIILIVFGFGLAESVKAATILSENFDSTCFQGQSCTIPPPTGWNDDDFWNLGRTQCANIYRGSGSYAASAYQLDFWSLPSMLATKGLSMSTSGNYTLTFWVRIVGSCAASGTNVGLKVYRGTSQLVRGTQIGSTFTLTSTTWSQKTINFTVPSNGTYYIQFDELDGSNNYVVLDDVIVNETITNNPPTISAVSDEPDIQQGNSVITFSSTASDPDSGNTIRLFICKDASCSNCNSTTQTNCWAYSASGVTSNPTASYTCPPCTYAANNYWAQVCDNNNACSTTPIAPTDENTTFTCKKQNGCDETTTAGNCYSGYAVDGYCCSGACGGNCDRCNVAGSLGTCTNVDADCTGNCDVCSGGSCAASASLCTGNCDDCTGSGTAFNCSANATYCTGNCDVCSGSGTAFSCAANNSLCSNTDASCLCSGSGTAFNCQSCAQCRNCSSYSCNIVSCVEDSTGTTCSGSNICNGSGSCGLKAANDNPCSVTGCTACSPSSSCIFCASGYCLSGGTCGLASQPPTISSVSASSPIVEQSTQTITPTGQGDPESNPLHIYCCQDTTNTCTPTTANICNNDQAWTSPYSGMTCTLTTADVSSATTYYARCRLYDGTNYSINTVSTSYVVKQKNGDICSSGTNCFSGNCVDGYCCNSACSGNCDRCNVAGSLGTCTNVNADCGGNCAVCSGGNCAASVSLCTGNCDVCSGGGTIFNCAADQAICSACSDCSGSGTAYNCSALDNTEDTTGTTCAGACKYCSAGTCTTVTCAEEGYGTTCSGSNICNGSGNCGLKTANDNPCSVPGCTACSPSRSCIFCASSYCGPNGTCTIPYYLYGWSWAENIGWISFNCVNQSWCGTSNYKVNLIPIASNTYKLEGYAWSENIGWISFNRSETGAPPDSDPCFDEACIAKLDTSTSPPQVSGWARALAYGDGWSGWLKLRDTNYGIWLDTNVSPNELRNWAWSDMVMGWQSFNRANCDANKDGLSDGTPAGCPSAGTPISNYKVMANLVFNGPPNVISTQIANENYCTVGEGMGQVGFQWTYNDVDGNDQSQYQLQIATDSSFTNLKVDSTNNSSVPSGGTGTSAVLVVNSPTSDTSDLDIGYGATYYWRVKVKDNQGNWSEYSDTKSFNTPVHAYPWPEFNWSPPSPQKENNITFNSQSHFFGSQQNLRWDFNNDGLDDSPLSNPTWSYSLPGRYPVKLIAEDELGSCQVTHDVRVISPVPKWKEIPPQTFKWFKNFLADIFESVKLVFF